MSKDAQNKDDREQSSSSESELEDLECLNFPGDVDWSSTLVIRCDPKGGPYSLSDVVNALHDVVKRNNVYSLGPTFLGHVFTISFKTTYAQEGFVKFMQSSKMTLKVKGHRCTITRVPPKVVTIRVRHIPLEVDSAHVIASFAEYGQIVKTELVKNNFRGWFHVYTNERKLTMHLKSDVTTEDLPYSIEVKGLFGCVYVAERNPKCLECYYSGHKGEFCEYTDCILYKGRASGH